MPFLIVLSGIVAIYGACVLLVGRRSRAKSTVLMVAAASMAVAVFPLLSNFDRGAQAGHRLLQLRKFLRDISARVQTYRH